MRKVSIEDLKPGMVTKRPVLGFVGQVMLSADVDLKASHIYYLQQMGIKAIYIHDEKLADVAVNDLISDQLRGESRALLAQVMKDIDSAAEVKKGFALRERELNDVISRIIDEVIKNSNSLVQLSDIRSQDGYIFAHSVNCCVLSVFMGVKINYSRKALSLLATGAFLHDIGFVAVPQAILKKPVALTDEEYAAVKKHPDEGYQLFRQSRLFSERVGEIIYHHHERYNGDGYPGGLKGKEIASLARVVMVADVYDALTSDKTYRRAYPAHEVAGMLEAWSGELFDPEIVALFLENLALYPVGSQVILSSGESGLVVANNKAHLAQPVVRLLYKRDLSPHPAPYDLDLSKFKEISISGLVH